MLGDLAGGELNDMFEELSPQKTATVFIIVNNIIGALSQKRFVEPNIYMKYLIVSKIIT